MAKSKRDKPKAETEPYRATEREKASLGKQLERPADEAASPRIKVSYDKDAPVIAPDHPNRIVAWRLLAKALGTTSADFLKVLLDQLANASKRNGQIDEDRLNFVLSVVKGIKPRDQLETMLAAQMATIHMATMTFIDQLGRVENLPQQDSAERAVNKLTRTFTSQMEALKRYRTGGEQKVTVQHVSVNEGGQAIVGNISQTSSQKAPHPPKHSTPI